MEKRKIKQNVLDVIEKGANEIGKIEKDFADMSMYFKCLESKMESPIEEMLYCALYTVIKLNLDNKQYINIYPQHKIDNYRIDFMVIKEDDKGYCNKLFIECDSQEFHERTEKERRYEKMRDRYLISKGHSILHYTGAEIYTKPFEIAREIISILTGRKKEEILIDSNIE